MDWRSGPEGGIDMELADLVNAMQIVELSEKSRGIAYGGVPLIHRLAQQTGLIAAIDRRD